MNQLATVDVETGEIFASTVEDWAHRINASWQKSVIGILETAQLVVQALTEFTQEELVPKLIFSQATLSCLNRVGIDGRLYHHGNNLPASWRTLYELTRLTDEQWAVAESGGGKGGLPLLRPDVQRKEITYFRNYQSRGVQPPPPLPNGQYNVIYADPPWQYEFSKSDSREIENQYPTMALEEICDLDVESIAAPDCVLLLWTTSPKLAEAFAVIDAWGFTYKTCAIWDKQKIGMGYYFRQQHELLLVATTGSPPAPDAETRPSSIFSAPRGEHSAKPISVYEALERMYPSAARIELFCRNPRPGWATWGNQIVA